MKRHFVVDMLILTHAQMFACTKTEVVSSGCHYLLITYLLLTYYLLMTYLLFTCYLVVSYLLLTYHLLFTYLLLIYY